MKKNELIELLKKIPGDPKIEIYFMDGDIADFIYKNDKEVMVYNAMEKITNSGEKITFLMLD